MSKQRVAVIGLGLTMLLTLGPGERVSAASSLPALPGAVASGLVRPYTDTELGFEVLLPDRWQVRGYEAGPSGTDGTQSGETAWCEFRADSGVWVRVIRTTMQLDPAAGGLTSADREALAAWLSGSYYAWQWVTPLVPATSAGTGNSASSSTTPPTSTSPTSSARSTTTPSHTPTPSPTPSPSTGTGSLLLAHGSGEGFDSAGERVQLHLWAFAAEDYIASPTGPEAPLWLFIAGGPVAEVEHELGLLKAMAATFRPLAHPNTDPVDLLLQPLQLPELQLSLEQPRGWEVYVGRQSAERLVQLAASDGKALLLIHLISYETLAFGEKNATGAPTATGTAGPAGSGSSRSVADRDAVQLLGRAYLASLTVPAEEGGEGLTAVDVQVAGLTSTAPARFEAIFAYDDPQVGLAAGWLLVQLLPAGRPDTSPTVLILEARSLADRFDLLYPTFRAVSESIRLLP